MVVQDLGLRLTSSLEPSGQHCPGTLGFCSSPNTCRTGLGSFQAPLAPGELMVLERSLTLAQLWARPTNHDGQAETLPRWAWAEVSTCSHPWLLAGLS